MSPRSECHYSSRERCEDELSLLHEYSLMQRSCTKCRIKRNLLSKQAKQEVGCVGVQSQRGHGDESSSMSPVLVVILEAVYNCMGSGCLPMHHFTYINTSNALFCTVNTFSVIFSNILQHQLCK